MFPRRIRRTLGAAILCLSLGAATQLPLASDSSASPQNAPKLVADPAPPAPVVRLGNGDEVRVSPTSDPDQKTVQALPREDGTTPSLLVNTDSSGTFVRATDSDAAPTPIGPTSTRPKATAADDLVELRFEVIGRDGRPASGHVTILDVETGAVQAYRTLPADPQAACTTAPSAPSTCILVPPGTYSLMGLVTTMPADKPSTVKRGLIQSLSVVGEPQATVTEDRIVTLDARRARAVSVETPKHRTKVNAVGAMEIGFSRTSATGRTMSSRLHPKLMLDQRFYLQPTASVTIGTLQTLTRLRLEAPDIEMTAPRGRSLHPEYYERAYFSDVASQFPVYDGAAKLRVVDVGHASPADLVGKNLRGAVAVAERTDDLSVAAQSNAAAAAGAEFVVIHNDSPGDNGDPNGAGTLLQAPTVRLSRTEGLALKALRARERVKVRGESVTPYVYDMVLKEQNGIPKDLRRVVRPKDLATQTRTFHGQPSGSSTFSESAYAFQPGETASFSTVFPIRGGAQTRKEYRLADPESDWTYSASTPGAPYNSIVPNDPETRYLLGETSRDTYQPRERYTKTVGTAPITAGINPFRPVERSGDRMRIAIDTFIDADGNRGSASTSPSGLKTHFEVKSNGSIVGQTDALPSGTAQLPAGTSRMEIAFTVENPQKWNELSTRTETVWGFTSSPVATDKVKVQPVIVADYDVPLDRDNRIRARGKHGVEFDLNLSHLEGARPRPIRDVTVEASYDDGTTWRPARLSRSDGRHHVELPRGKGFVSLRLHAADRDGSTLDQTIIRAWFVAG